MKLIILSSILFYLSIYKKSNNLITMLQIIYESIELDKKFIKLILYTKYLIK